MAPPEVSQTLDVRVKEDPVNPTVRDTEQDRSERQAFAIEDHRRLAVELVLLDLEVSRDAPGRLDHERCDAAGTVQRYAKIAKTSDAPAFAAPIRDQHGVFREHPDQRADVARVCGLHECAKQAAVRLLRRGEQAFLGSNVLARALEELAAGGFTPADERRNLVVGEIEDVVQQQHGAFGRCQALQHDEERHRYLIERPQTTPASFVEIYGLRQTIASALLATVLRRVELV